MEGTSTSETRRVSSRNTRLAYIIAATHQVGFLTPVWVIFGTDKLHLSLTLALILGSTSWVTSALFEIPMGAFADKYGRKTSIIAGLALCALGDFTLVIFDQFWLLMIFQTIAGVGFAMRSGSLEGLLHDTFEAEGELTIYSKLSSHMLFLLNMSRVLTVPIGAWLYDLDIKANPSSFTYPYIAGTAAYLVALGCACFLAEKRSQTQAPDVDDGHVSWRKKSVGQKLIGQIGETFTEMKANRDVVRIVILLGLYALIGEGNWALYQSYFRHRGIDIAESGWLYTGLVVCMALGARFVPAVYKRLNVMWAMIGIIFLVSCGIVLMHLPLWCATIAFIVNALVGPMCFYLHDNAIQNRMSGDHKTSSLSVASMSYTIGAAIGVFGVGALADRYGVLKAQWIFVVYGFAVCVAMGLWCLKDGFEVLGPDRKGLFGHEEEPMEESPVAEVAQAKP